MAHALKQALKQSTPVLFSEQEKIMTLCAMPEGALPPDFIVIIDHLLEQGGSWRKADDKGVTPLSLACKNGNIQAVSFFIARSENVNAFPSLLTDAVEGKNGPIIELLLKNMTTKSVLTAQKEAYRRGMAYLFQEEINKYAKILCFEQKRHQMMSFLHPELVVFEAVQPPLKVTLGEFWAQFFSFSARKRADARALISLKKAYQKHQKIHFEDVYMNAVMKRLPRTFDFVESIGAPFLVQEKAFQKIKDTSQEDKFIAHWVDVTDSVCDIRHHRRDVFYRRYRFMKGLSHYLKFLFRKPLNHIEDIVLSNKPVQKKKLFISEKTFLKPLEKQDITRQKTERKKLSCFTLHLKDRNER